MRNTTRNSAIIIFGIVFPFIILLQAYTQIISLKTGVEYTTKANDLIPYMNGIKKQVINANDYALFSLIYVEHANQKVMINKQVMKTTTILLGFAVMSVGMMMIILGIKDTQSNYSTLKAENSSGVTASMETPGGIKFDFRTGSAGVAMFCIGAIMATAGGVLPNEYKTSEIPTYESMTSKKDNEEHDNSIKAYKTCSKQKHEQERCFYKEFFLINKKSLK